MNQKSNFKPLKQIIMSGIIDLKLFKNVGKKIQIDFSQLSSFLSQIQQEKFPQHKNKGIISVSTLKQRIKLINPNYPVQQINFLCGNRKQIKASEIYQILEGRQMKDYDPLKQSLKMLSDNKNNLDFNKVNYYLTALGHQKLSKQDINILIQCFAQSQNKNIQINELYALFYEISKRRQQ